LEGINAHYVNYYDNGQLLSEGNIVDGYLFGAWKFYNINGTLIHEVVFNDTTIALPNDTNLISITGFYKGYYANGIKRCEGYLSNLDLDYDCFTKQDKAVLDFYVLDFFDINGKQTIKQGNGYFVKYDPNGVRISSGKLVNCREDSLWSYYTPEQKLTETGAYILGKKDGVWYSGDLEAINFEDGACFDLQNKFEAKEYEEKRKELTIEKRIYDHGKIISSSEFYSNTNKTYNEQVLNGW
jgi:antitoxin component YwqK of YwqJK toxin-antitoxin module